MFKKKKKARTILQTDGVLQVFREEFKELAILLKDVTALAVMGRGHANWDVCVKSHVLITAATSESSHRGHCH